MRTSRIAYVALGLIALLLALCLSACSEFFPGDGHFYVKTVKEGRATTDYQLIQTKGNGATWITAGRGDYHIGDTLYLKAKK